MAQEDALARAFECARGYSATQATRPVWPTTTLEQLREALGGPLPSERTDPAVVVSELAHAADPGIVATTGPRYFGFVTGGAMPATIGAEWLTTAWDQNAGLYVMSPAASVAEEVAAAALWLLSGASAYVTATIVDVAGGR